MSRTLTPTDRIAVAAPRSESPRRARILYLAHRLPYPPDKGDRIRSYQILRHLAERHDVDLVAFIEPAATPGHIETLRRLCRSVTTVPWTRFAAAARAGVGFLLGRSLTRAAYDFTAVHRAVRQFTAHRPYDAAVAFSSSMTPYALAVPARRRILDFCDADSEKWSDLASAMRGPRAWFLRCEARRLRRDEFDWSRRADLTVFVHERERRLLTAHGTPGPTTVIGNGVRVPLDPPPDASDADRVVGFLGALHYRPNADAVRWFLRCVWPIVRRRVPNATFRIIGPQPPRDLGRWDGRDGILVTGRVEDLGAALAPIRVGVAPLRISRGVPNKVLDFLAHRRPVVATPAAAGGLLAAPGRDLLVADRPTDFAARVVELLIDDVLCDAYARAGHRCVLARYSWEPLLVEFERAVLGTPAPQRTAFAAA
ncbi:MAG: TIGR03087 family PEP-CTERM/XrtA system glycosyltransferase [Phycisphaerae bacterium]|nr:TIGR03087 family PEP-CTERM/XrtA system glycosyltransferase [Phycisphaerae bacterium]